MRTAMRRRLLGAASVAGLILAANTTIGGPVPAESYPKAVEADIAHLDALVELDKTKKGIPGRIKATAILIACYAQDNMKGADADKMAALRAKALAVAEMVAKKDKDGTAKAVAALKSVKPDGSADKKPVKLAGMHKIDLHDVMHLFGASAGGGMNIEKDIRTMKKEGVKDTKLAELIGVRSAAIADLALDLPPDFGGKRVKKDWDDLNKEMKSLSGDLAAEAAKGSKANADAMKKTITALDANCVNCHNKFRDD